MRNSAWLHECTCVAFLESVIFQMTLYSRTAIHGHRQVQCQRERSGTWCSRIRAEWRKSNVGRISEECRKEEAAEGRARGNSWVKGAWVMGNGPSAAWLWFCAFSLALLSPDPAQPQPQQNWGRTVRWLEGWRDEVTQEKGMSGKLNGRRHQPCFVPECETKGLKNLMNFRLSVSAVCTQGRGWQVGIGVGEVVKLSHGSWSDRSSFWCWLCELLNSTTKLPMQLCNVAIFSESIRLVMDFTEKGYSAGCSPVIVCCLFRNQVWVKCRGCIICNLWVAFLSVGLCS